VLCDGEAPTGVAAIAVDDAAQNCIIVIPGANARLTPADIHGAAATIADAKLLIAQLEVPLETVQEALLLARRHELLTILNCAPAQPLADDLLKLVDVCVLNESELETLTGSKGETMHEVIAASWNLLGRGPRQVIVTLGSDGALVVDATSAEHVPGVPVSAVDSSGAGDAFIGSLAVWLAEGYDLTESARRANAVAALSVTRFGTQSSFPSRDEVTAFLRERAFAEE
jgi:ribokinase